MTTNRGVCIGGPKHGQEISNMDLRSRHIEWDRAAGTMAEDGFTVHVYLFEGGYWKYHPELIERVDGGRPAC